MPLVTLLRHGLMTYFVWTLQIPFQILVGEHNPKFPIPPLLPFQIILFNKKIWIILRLPHPKECDLYYVNRDTLFSYHKESEIFLQVKINYVLFCALLSYIWKISSLIVKNKFYKLKENVFHLPKWIVVSLIFSADDGTLCCFPLQKFTQ